MTLQNVPSRAEAEALAEKILARVKADEVMIEIDATNASEAEFSRNQLLHLQGAVDITADLQISVNGRRARAATHDTSDAALARLVEQVQDMAETRVVTNEGSMLPELGEVTMPEGMHSESTAAAVDVGAFGDTLQTTIAKSTDAGLISAGTLSREVGSNLIRTSSGYGGFSRHSYAEFEMSSRTQSGTGSGWAWGGTEDVAKVDIDAIAARSMELAETSENPVAVEPGRYTVILEPEATAQLLDQILGRYTDFISARAAERNGTVFSRQEGGHLVGEAMADPRVQLFYDPFDAMMPFSPIHRQAILQRTHWLHDGVLESLAYDPGYAKQHDLRVTPNPMRVRMDFNDIEQSRDEMIARTKRGILVTRFSYVSSVDEPTLLLTGVTRDGTFLIENGKITRPIRNMRFMESPFFLFNKIESASRSQRARRNIVSPRLLVNDFEFTSLSDAI